MRRARLLGLLAVLAGGASLAGPGTAGALVMGTPDIGPPDYGTGCDGPGTCVVVQTKEPGLTLKAPHNGVIRKWQVWSSGFYDFQLVVVRKVAGGKFKPVAASYEETAPSAGVHTFKTYLRIKEGDYIGLLGNNFGGYNTVAGERALFNPPLGLGESGTPTNVVPQQLLYNATVKR